MGADASPSRQRYSHQARSVPLSGPVVVVDVIGTTEIVHLLFPARGQRRGRELLLVLRGRVIRVYDLPAMLGKKTK